MYVITLNLVLSIAVSAAYCMKFPFCKYGCGAFCQKHIVINSRFVNSCGALSAAYCMKLPVCKTAVVLSTSSIL